MDVVLWIVLGVVLAVAEMFTFTFVLIMLSSGAFAAAIAAALGAGVAVQAIVFAVVSALALLAVRPVIKRHRQSALESGDTPMGVEAIEGATGLVLEQVDADHGLVKIDGELWSARAYDGTQVLEAGERVRVIEVRGATAMVWRDI
ncbi:NfeD family protein [Phytohabitans aurantiacus]|uniref:Membrane protein n=1 Tax=Phytohabitans aurantiacus TaxID=3016789 RepID=A0ABQ5QWK7_9ACTN|nr:NfeD family protein [Phytohabitans aurantiacus]GLH98948.1 membrane protein [Phytohabitans aurantiacus]